MEQSERIQRINELAHKEKSSGLTDEEKEEQQALRQAYLQDFRESFKNQLKNVKVVDPEGEDVTPQKLKDEQEKERHKAYRNEENEDS